MRRLAFVPALFFAPLTMALFFAQFVVLGPTPAFGQLSLIDEEQRLRSKQPPNISNDLMDPTGGTRLHLTTRTTFSLPDELFSANSFWSFDLQAFLRIADNWSVNTALPFGLVAPESGTNQFVFGNLRIGTAGGFAIRLQPGHRDKRSARLRLGVGLDVYLPTAEATEAQSNLVGEVAIAAIRRLHSFEPELFVNDAMFFRLRGHAQLSFDVVILEAELGLSPGFTV